MSRTRRTLRASALRILLKNHVAIQWYTEHFSSFCLLLFANPRDRFQFLRQLSLYISVHREDHELCGLIAEFFSQSTALHPPFRFLEAHERFPLAVGVKEVEGSQAQYCLRVYLRIHESDTNSSSRD